MNNDFKRRVYEVIEVSNVGDASSRAYDVLMTTAVIVGMIPLTLKSDNIYTFIIEILTGIVFIIDYCARVYTADYKMGYKGAKAYFLQGYRTSEDQLNPVGLSTVPVETMEHYKEILLPNIPNTQLRGVV